MNILITFDYELFFGSQTGTQQRCITGPTNELIKLAEKHGVRFSFFIDCGYLVKLEEHQQKNNKLALDYQEIVAQIKFLSAKGHDVQLHIHPHWENSFHDGNQWVMNTSNYRLHQFSEKRIQEIFQKYAGVLFQITKQPLHTYRAGGWCLQPFDKLKSCFENAGIKADSSVFKEGFEKSEHYYYDFRNCPNKDWWKFDNDPVLENSGGKFLEIPISSHKVSPLFYWKLYLLGRINPRYHKPIGDGKPILSKGYKKRILSRYTRQVVSTDGYNARLLQRYTEKQFRKEASTIVILGHPKALSPYSLDALDEYIAENKNKHQIITFTDFLKINNSL
jgi:hypothetical protein